MVAIEEFELILGFEKISGDDFKRKHFTKPKLEGIPRILEKERLSGVGDFLLIGLFVFSLFLS